MDLSSIETKLTFEGEITLHEAILSLWLLSEQLISYWKTMFFNIHGLMISLELPTLAQKWVALRNLRSIYNPNILCASKLGFRA